MDKLEKYWRDAPAAYVVCAETGVTKNMVLNAIVDGAGDFETLKKTISLCENDVCTTKNPSGAGCSENANMILSIYAPIFDLMKKGHSDDHEHSEECGGEPSGGCGSCKLCQ